MTWYTDGSIDMGNLDVFATDKALGDYRVCMLDCDDETVSEQTLAANARLIAAAPDLLQTLQWLICEADEDMPSEHRSDSFTSALDAAIAAIAKAKGN